MTGIAGGFAEGSSNLTGIIWFLSIVWFGIPKVYHMPVLKKDGYCQDRSFCSRKDLLQTGIGTKESLCLRCNFNTFGEAGVRVDCGERRLVKTVPCRAPCKQRCQRLGKFPTGPTSLAALIWLGNTQCAGVGSRKTLACLCSLSINCPERCVAVSRITSTPQK